MSKIPILSKNNRNGHKKPQILSSEMNGEQMFLLAKIATLEKENNILVEEKAVALQKLEAAEWSMSKLKAEILAINDKNKEEIIKQQAEMAELRKYKNKSFHVARRIQNVTDRKLAETEIASKDKIASISKTAKTMVKETEKRNKQTLDAALDEKEKEIRIWKDKFEELDNSVDEFNAEVNKEWPVLSDDETTAMVSHISSKRDQVQSSRLRTGDGHERAIIEFRPGFSMAAILELNNDGVTEFKNDQIRRVPLEDEPCQNGKE